VTLLNAVTKKIVIYRKLQSPFFNCSFVNICDLVFFHTSVKRQRIHLLIHLLKRPQKDFLELKKSHKKPSNIATKNLLNKSKKPSKEVTKSFLK
jgi:hypothetical protein